MADNRFPFSPTGGPRETVCIQTDRVMDCCRDRDCFENVRVYLTGFGNEALERISSIRPKEAKIIGSNIGVDPIQFNKGFYSVTARFYVKIVCETCMDLGRGQDICGIAVLEKKVILYGGEGNSTVYKSQPSDGRFGFCNLPDGMCEKTGPTASVELVDPVFLDARILERRDCPFGCPCNGFPEFVQSMFDGPIVQDDNGIRHILVVSLGLFSIVRLLRTGQYLVSASEYVIPEKECINIEEDDPCHIFRKMPFPVSAFSSTGMTQSINERQGRCGCGS